MSHYDDPRISESEWVWITRQNRERAEQALREAIRDEAEARKRVGLPPVGEGSTKA